MSLGSKIRARRRQLDMTLQTTANGAGLSKPFLSQIERDLATPSLTSLIGIAKALGVSTEFFMGVPDETQMVSRRDERRFFTLDASANRYARLTSNTPQRQLETLLVHIPPYSRFQEVTAHAGEEVIYVLQGQLQLEVNKQHSELHAGDSAHYLSSDQHLWANPSHQECVVLWIGTPKLF